MGKLDFFLIILSFTFHLKKLESSGNADTDFSELIMSAISSFCNLINEINEKTIVCCEKKNVEKQEKIFFLSIYLLATALPLFPTGSSLLGLFSDCMLWLDIVKSSLIKVNLNNFRFLQIFWSKIWTRKFQN